MVEKIPVNVNLQTLLVFLPFVCFWGFNRIGKLKRGLGLMFGIFFGVLFFIVFLNIITRVSATEYTNVTIVFYILSVLIGIYYMRKWSEEWNEQIKSKNS